MPLTQEEKNALMYTGVLVVVLVLLIGILTAMHISLILAGVVGALVVVVVMIGEMIGRKYPRYRIYYYALSLFVIVILIGLAMNGSLGTLGISNAELQQALFETTALAIAIVVAIGFVLLYYAEKKHKVLTRTFRGHL
jgi:D-alanyl-lipoteichoic acid acyltransferase DltB (MBOAT superfamily)